jgi:peptidoglycan/LPS O-acetylase OafA/YrhL
VALGRRTQKWQLAREFIGVGVLIAVSFAFRSWALHISLTAVRNGHRVPVCKPHCFTDPPLSTLFASWLPAYLDLFALGILLAVASAWFSEHDSEPTWLANRFMPYVSWACAAVAFWAVSHLVSDRQILYIVSPHVNIERQELYGIFAFALLLPAVFGRQDRGAIRRLLRWWPVASLGVISYGIYLWHLNLIDPVMQWAGWRSGAVPFWLLAITVLAVTTAFASASYFGLERPILRMKNRIGWWDRRGRSSVRKMDAETSRL